MTAARVLTTHVGSLPRPAEVVDLLFRQDRGEPYDASEFDAVMRRNVEQAVARQKEIGLDIVSDGEMSKISYATYIRHRLTGFEGDAPRSPPKDLEDFPDYLKRLATSGGTPKYLRPICRGRIEIKDTAPLTRDIANMTGALKAAGAGTGFMNAVSPGTIAVFQPNEYYPTQEAYLAALAAVMRAEYEAIVDAGLMLQVDCPDLGMGRHIRFKGLSEKEFLRQAELQVEALNEALVNIPADRLRMHICWGNYEGPHTHDISLEAVLPLLFRAKPAALLIEGANPRHEHEWEVWKTVRLPEGKILVPGVIGANTNYVEHPRLVAQRIERYAGAVGRERVIAGTDCGFGTFAGFGAVDPAIAWEKLRALVEGAAIASRSLYPVS